MSRDSSCTFGHPQSCLELIEVAIWRLSNIVVATLSCSGMPVGVYTEGTRLRLQRHCCGSNEGTRAGLLLRMALFVLQSWIVRNGGRVRPKELNQLPFLFLVMSRGGSGYTLDNLPSPGRAAMFNGYDWHGRRIEVREVGIGLVFVAVRWMTCGMCEGFLVRREAVSRILTEFEAVAHRRG